MNKERLPRRYDEPMKALRELMRSKSERVRLQATLRATEILMEHDRSIERQAIAIERAAARKAEAEAGSPAPVEPEPAISESTEDAAQRLIDRIAVRMGVQELEDEDDE